MGQILHRRKAFRGGGGGTLTSGLLAWYDMAVSSTKDLTDQTGTHGNLVEPGTVAVGTNYVTVDDKASPNILRFPSGLVDTSPAWLSAQTDNGTLLMAVGTTGTSSGGDYPLYDTSTSLRFRYFPAEWRIMIGGIEVNTGIAAASTQVIGGTFTGDASSPTVEAFIDGVSGGSASPGTYTACGTTQMSRDNLSSSDAEFNIYWIGVWDRVLESAELSSSQLTSISTKYADL